MVFCGQCGARNPDTMKFCGQCGAKLQGFDQQLAKQPLMQSIPATETEVLSTSSNSFISSHLTKKTIAIAAVLSLIVIAAVAIFILNGNGHEPAKFEPDYSGMYIDISDADYLYSMTGTSIDGNLTIYGSRIYKSTDKTDCSPVKMYKSRSSSGILSEPFDYNNQLTQVKKVGEDYLLTFYGEWSIDVDSLNNYCDQFFKDHEDDDSLVFGFLPGGGYSSYLVDGETGQMFFVPALYSLTVQASDDGIKTLEHTSVSIVGCSSSKVYATASLSDISRSLGLFSFCISNGKLVTEKVFDATVRIVGVGYNDVLLLEDKKAVLPNGSLISLDSEFVCRFGIIMKNISPSNSYIVSADVLQADGSSVHVNFSSHDSLVFYILSNTPINAGPYSSAVVYDLDNRAFFEYLYRDHEINKNIIDSVDPSIVVAEPVLKNLVECYGMFSHFFIVNDGDTLFLYDARDNSKTVIFDDIQFVSVQKRQCIVVECTDSSLKTHTKYVDYFGNISDIPFDLWIDAAFDLNLLSVDFIESSM